MMKRDVDGRDKPGHDERGGLYASRYASRHLVDRLELCAKHRPVVAGGDRRPDRLDLLDQHRAGIGPPEEGVTEVDAVAWRIILERFSYRIERLAGIEILRRTLRGAVRAGQPPNQSKKVCSNGALVSDRKVHSARDNSLSCCGSRICTPSRLSIIAVKCARSVGSKTFSAASSCSLVARLSRHSASRTRFQNSASGCRPKA